MSREGRLFHVLCDHYNLPRLPVKVVKDLKGDWGYFDNKDYEWVVERGIPFDRAVHEFSHYMVHLISRAGEIEESLCDLVAGCVPDWKESERVVREVKAYKRYRKKL